MPRWASTEEAFRSGAAGVHRRRAAAAWALPGWRRGGSGVQATRAAMACVLRARERSRGEAEKEGSRGEDLVVPRKKRIGKIDPQQGQG